MFEGNDINYKKTQDIFVLYLPFFPICLCLSLESKITK